MAIGSWFRKDNNNNPYERQRIPNDEVSIMAISFMNRVVDIWEYQQAVSLNTKLTLMNLDGKDLDNPTLQLNQLNRAVVSQAQTEFAQKEMSKAINNYLEILRRPRPDPWCLEQVRTELAMVYNWCLSHNAFKGYERIETLMNYIMNKTHILKTTHTRKPGYQKEMNETVKKARGSVGDTMEGMEYIES